MRSRLYFQFVLRIQFPSANEKNSYFPLRSEPLAVNKLSRVALGTRMADIILNRQRD